MHAQVQLIIKYAGTLPPADYQQFFFCLPRNFSAAMRWLQDTPQHDDLFKNLCYIMNQGAAPAQARLCSSALHHFCPCSRAVGNVSAASWLLAGAWHKQQPR